MFDTAWPSAQEIALNQGGKTHIAQYVIVNGRMVVMKTPSGMQSALIGSLQPEMVARALLAELVEQGKL